MVLTDKKKSVIENDFNEKGWNPYKIWKKYPSFECSRMAVLSFINKIKETGSTENCKGSARPITATTEKKHIDFWGACLFIRRWTWFERAGKLLKRFSIHSLPQLVFQYEKDFSFQWPTNRQSNRVYFNGPKKDVKMERLHSKRNKYLKKVMGSAVISWKGVGQPFFIGGNGIKMNGASWLKHLRDDLIPAVVFKQGFHIPAR